MMKYKYLDPELIISTPEFEFIETFLKTTGKAKIGWHYIMDLAWIYSQARNWPTNYRILDAGGGRGPTQFLLAELGFNVTNIDLFLNEPAHSIKNRYQMEFDIAENYQKTDYVDHLAKKIAKPHILRNIKRAIGNSTFYQYVSAEKHGWIHERWRVKNKIVDDVGRITWTKANLCSVPEIDTDTFDAVVSLSALEHIAISLLPQAWAEITRICKPDAKVAVTTSATEQKTTWFHQPSQGNCFSEQDMERIFGAQADENNPPIDEMLGLYQTCTYLKDNLAGFYSKSGENGMPWGKWEPKYFPVGIFK